MSLSTPTSSDAALEFFFPPGEAVPPVDRPVVVPAHPAEPAPVADLTVREAATLLGISVMEAYTMTDYGELHVVRVGRELRVKPAEIERLLGQRRAGVRV